MHRPHFLLASTIAAFLAFHDAGSSAAGKPPSFMMRARVNGQMLEGRPLYWTDTQMLLMGRNGTLYIFDPRQAKEARKTSPEFYGYSIGEMKNELYRELNKQFSLTTTQHFVVAHPHDQGKEWAERFENLFRSFIQYFRIRDFQISNPKYPLVAIVFRNKEDYFEYATSQGSHLQPGTLGHYELKTNRVLLFDQTTHGSDWTENADTIIHEATHQMAFNTGIHKRFTETPMWIVEGLATMFEARGVWDSQSHQTQKDRINRDRLSDFHSYVQTGPEEGLLQRLIANDTFFQSDPTNAYATAWALSFYLCETRPRLYSQYLARTANREMFTEYSDAMRIADFQAIFGVHMQWLESEFLKYMSGIK